MRILTLFLSFCLLLPAPAFALRSGVEGTVPAGVEARLQAGIEEDFKRFLKMDFGAIFTESLLDLSRTEGLEQLRNAVSALSPQGSEWAFDTGMLWLHLMFVQDAKTVSERWEAIQDWARQANARIFNPLGYLLLLDVKFPAGRRLEVTSMLLRLSHPGEVEWWQMRKGETPKSYPIVYLPQSRLPLTHKTSFATPTGAVVNLSAISKEIPALEEALHRYRRMRDPSAAAPAGVDLRYQAVRDRRLQQAKLLLNIHRNQLFRHLSMAEPVTPALLELAASGRRWGPEQIAEILGLRLENALKESGQVTHLQKRGYSAAEVNVLLRRAMVYAESLDALRKEYVYPAMARMLDALLHSFTDSTGALNSLAQQLFFNAFSKEDPARTPDYRRLASLDSDYLAQMSQALWDWTFDPERTPKDFMVRQNPPVMNIEERDLLPKAAEWVLVEGRVRWSKAGVEAKLRPAKFPAVEEINPGRLRSKKLRVAFLAFDDLLWLGYPHQEANAFFAERLGLNSKDPRIEKLVRQFIQSVSGLPWREVVARLHARRWSPPPDFTEEKFLPEWRGFVDKLVMEKKLADPSHLMPGSRELLSAFQADGLRQVIVTGAEAESRKRYAEQLGIWEFFGEGRIYGGGEKTAAIQKEMAEHGIGPLEGVFIGDGPKDVEIARRAGLIAVGYAATPEAREAFLELPPELGPDVILNGDLSALHQILSVLGVPDPNRAARLKEYEHWFLQDINNPSEKPRQYTVYISEIVKRDPRPGEKRSHHVGAKVSLSPYEGPIGFLPLSQMFEKDPEGAPLWVGEKIQLLNRLKEEKRPIEVAVKEKGNPYARNRHMNYVFRLVKPWTRLEVLRHRHSVDQLTEPMFLSALARGIPIPVAVRNGVSPADLAEIQAEAVETTAELLRQTHFFSGNPGAGPFKVQVEEDHGALAPRLLLLENGTTAFSPLEQPIALDRVIARALWEFSEMAKASGKTTEGKIVLRVEQVDQFLILELMNNGPGVLADDLGDFLFALMGSKPSGWLATYGSEMLRRYRGWMEVDTRSGEKGGAYRILFDPANPDVELREHRPGARQGRGTTVRWVFSLDGPVRGYFTAAGTEQVTPERVREWAVSAGAPFQNGIAQIAQLLEHFPENSGFDWVRLMRQRLAEIGSLAGQLKKLARELEESSAVHERTAGYELEEPLNRILVAASEPPAEMEQGTVEGWLALAMDTIRLNARQMEKVLAELKALEEIRLTDYHDATLLALGSSQNVLPKWEPIGNLLLLLPTSRVPQKRLIFQVAAEAGADSVMLIPLAAHRDRTIHLRPFVYGSLERRAEVESYLESANRMLQEYGIWFAPMMPYDSAQVDTMGFVLFEEAPPFPGKVPAFAAQYLSAGNPGRLHPALVAAKVLHPNLSWDFLKGYQVKGLMLVEDSVTGARYLAVLA